MKKTFAGILLSFLFLTEPQAAASALSVEDARFRPGVGGRPGVIYFKLSNRGGVPRTLKAVGSESTGRIEIHTHEMQDGIARMRRLDSLTVAPGAGVMFEPHGLHLMVFGFKPRSGDVTVTLTFEDGEKLSFIPEIVKFGGK